MQILSVSCSIFILPWNLKGVKLAFHSTFSIRSRNTAIKFGTPKLHFARLRGCPLCRGALLPAAFGNAS